MLSNLFVQEISCIIRVIIYLFQTEQQKVIKHSHAIWNCLFPRIDLCGAVFLFLFRTEVHFFALVKECSALRQIFCFLSATIFFRFFRL